MPSFPKSRRDQVAGLEIDLEPKVKSRKRRSRPITYLHCGKKVPKGFYESGKGIHLGKGIWLLRMRPNPGISTRKALAILTKLK